MFTVKVSKDSTNMHLYEADFKHCIYDLVLEEEFVDYGS